MEAQLRKHARQFGEALQLVNILKDQAADAECGRFLSAFDHGRLGEVFSLARTDLTAADAYIEALRSGGAPDDYIFFTSLPVRLAHRTLEVVEQAGAGAKLSRAEVAQLYTEVVGKPFPQGSLQPRSSHPSRFAR